MRLLNTRTGRFKWVEDPRREHYAILSHVWAKPGDPDYEPEQTYQDLLELQKHRLEPNTLPSGLSDKLRRFCETALKDGFELGWADTCCIDKTSSSELSEAITSMYSWYAYSGACYAFLRDVNPPNEDISAREWQATFKGSEWCKRGWTLQELIAPRIIVFVSKAPGAHRDGIRMPGWEVLGSKHNLAACISSETGINVAVLTFKTSLEEIPIAQRMAWMQSRETTRLEDEAYCLMGIFGVNMQVNYGEGRYAFIRLQEKILSQSADQTIFAWGRFLDKSSLTLLPSNPSSIPAASMPSDPRADPLPPSDLLEQYLLAPSPKVFDPRRSASLVCLSREEFQRQLGVPTTGSLYQVFEITPYGLRTHFPLLHVSSSDRHSTPATHCAILACEDPENGLLALLLRLKCPKHHSSGREYFAGASVIPNDIRQPIPVGGLTIYDSVWDHYYRLVYIPPKELRSLCTSTLSASSPSQLRVLPRVSVVYIPHCPLRSAIELERDSSIHAVLRSTMESFEVEFCRFSKRVLEQDGYNVTQIGVPSRLRDEPFIAPILKRTSTSGSRIIISGKFGVYLTIQVARCNCYLAERSGILGVLVSSWDANSLDGKSYSQEHERNHPIHINSWSFDHGSASRQIEFDSPKDMRRLNLRLVLTSESIAPSAGKLSVARRYRLSAELREQEESELPRPKQPLPLNPTSSRSTRLRSSSSPPMPVTSPAPYPVISPVVSPEVSPEVSPVASPVDTPVGSPVASRRPSSVPSPKPIERVVSRAPEPRELVDWRSHHDKGDIWHTVGLIAFGAFLAFALPLVLSLNVER